MAGAASYFLEHAAPNLSFSNPNGDFPEVRNSFFGQGGGYRTPGPQTSFSVTVVDGAPLGMYEWRVIALGPDSNNLGLFSDALRLTIGQRGQAGVD